MGLLVCAIIAMSLIGSDPERTEPEVSGGNLLVLLMPLVAVFGVAFFYLLLDRIAFRIKLTRGAAIGGFVLLNVAAMVFTLLPPRRNVFPYPPYAAPVTRAVAGYFETNALACSDLPCAMAWNGDRRTVWLPRTLDEFYEINDLLHRRAGTADRGQQDRRGLYRMPRPIGASGKTQPPRSRPLLHR